MRPTKVKAKNLRVGDFVVFEDATVAKIEVTAKGNASFLLDTGVWRRRPGAERIDIRRND